MSKDRIETDAYKASSEVGDKIYKEDSYFFKPWQFADYEVNICTLKSTYEEIYIWGTHQAMFRPGFKVEDNHIYITNIFAKISGVHTSKRQYRKEIKLLRKTPNTLFFPSFPLFRAKPSKLTNRSYYSVLDSSGYIDKKKLLSSQFWKYRQLRTSVQNLIADRIIDFCSLSRFKNYELWSTEPKKGLLDTVTDFLQNFDININLNTNTKSFELAKMKVFNILNDIDEPLIRLLSKFDYPFYVPKLVVYNNGSKFSKVTFEDVVKLTFINSLGADVIIYNPAGFNDIEDFIKESYYDIHRLDEVAFNLNYSSWTLF
ncbi:hypothetical protein JK636_01440 [Clostridium sp. YIM B02515]|uniref:Putative component of 'biosynthetic module' domain-containing protein n=1 Tax=Clostridium rhizosphaerae TaxID=2803861 RepID=A0ABS1T6Y2_9CLOT|nr:YceG family protein [Clostridium rhizosphaerae]MBL4934416.1 hypothetical protein [Clostridium rhizosphaerae]